MNRPLPFIIIIQSKRYLKDFSPSPTSSPQNLISFYLTKDEERELNLQLGKGFCNNAKIMNFLNLLPQTVSSHIIRYIQLQRRLTALSSSVMKYFYALVQLLMEINREIQTTQLSPTQNNCSSKGECDNLTAATIFNLSTIEKNPNGKPFAVFKEDIVAKLIQQKMKQKQEKEHNVEKENNNNFPPLMKINLDFNISHDASVAIGAITSGTIGLDIMCSKIHDYLPPLPVPTLSDPLQSLPHKLADPIDDLINTCSLSFTQEELSFFRNLNGQSLDHFSLIDQNQDVGNDICDKQSVGIDPSNDFIPQAQMRKIFVIVSSFFRCWTLKEAVVKAFGTGFSFPAVDISLIKYIDWIVHGVDNAHDNNNQNLEDSNNPKNGSNYHELISFQTENIPTFQKLLISTLKHLYNTHSPDRSNSPSSVGSDDIYKYLSRTLEEKLRHQLAGLGERAKHLEQITLNGLFSEQSYPNENNNNDNNDNNDNNNNHDVYIKPSLSQSVLDENSTHYIPYLSSTESKRTITQPQPNSNPPLQFATISMLQLNHHPVALPDQKNVESTYCYNHELNTVIERLLHFVPCDSEPTSSQFLPPKSLIEAVSCHEGAQSTACPSSMTPNAQIMQQNRPTVLNVSPYHIIDILMTPIGTLLDNVIGANPSK